VARTCEPGWPDGLPGRAFAVRAGARRTAKVMARQPGRRTAEKTHTAATTTHGSGDARQQRQRTAEKCARQRAGTHGNGGDARQRKRPTAEKKRTAARRDARQRPARTASSLPSDLREAHGKVVVAEHIVAVPVLPCMDARQCLCRAFWCFCRAICPHGKALFSGSEVHTRMYAGLLVRDQGSRFCYK
jgi:hypothetical protein